MNALDLKSNDALKGVRGFESLTFRQAKPKSNTKVFGLGFSFAKIQVLSVFLVVGVPSFQPFRGSYAKVRIAFAVTYFVYTVKFIDKTLFL